MSTWALEAEKACGVLHVDAYPKLRRSRTLPVSIMPLHIVITYSKQQKEFTQHWGMIDTGSVLERQRRQDLMYMVSGWPIGV